MAMKRERENINMANCLMLLTKVGESDHQTNYPFKCKTCNKEFSSFQALGGHRASHKRMKLMVTDNLYDHDHKLPMKPRMHPCPICGLEFAVGQALGGHMRKHRGTANNINGDGFLIRKKSKDAEGLNLCLDLNLTPLENDYLTLNLWTPVSVLNC